MVQHRAGAGKGSRKPTRADSEGLWDWNLESDRIHFSPRWIALVGCEDHEVGATPDEWFRRVHADDSAQLAREIASARAGESATFACRHRLRQKDGVYRWMLCRGEVIRDKGGSPVRLTGSHSDVTVEMVTDTLTGLPNRLLLTDRLTHSIERSRRYAGFHFAVLVIDLGRPVTPGASGSPATDPVLTAVARRLETCLRIPDMMPSLRNNDLVARMDGDRFAILLDGLKEISHAKIVGDRLLHELLLPFPISGRETRLSASIGVALSATGYATADEVIRDAETALHRANVLGGSRCEVFDTGILRTDQAELQLEGDFEGALQRGEFELFYQPIVSLASDELLGFEALVRWRHPVLGMISPADFLPVAEKSGFITPLGNWILREACLRLRAWQNALTAARDLSISINLSALQLSNETLVDTIAEVLRESGIEPHRVTLELTEGIAMANPTAVTTLLMRIRAMGVRISIDDFGTGYSSLAYLRQFPLDALKIDRSFVRGMVTNKDTAEIVASLIGMSRQLGLLVVAEGIEHEDHLARLRALNCDAGQGNLFAKPLDMARAAELIKTGIPKAERRRAAVAAEDDDGVQPAWMRARRALEDIGLFANQHRRSFIAATSAAVVLLAIGFQRGGSGHHSEATPRTTVADPARQRTAPPQMSVSSAPKSTVSNTAGAAPVAVKASSPVPLPSVSADVVHSHRLGSCHGRLTATPNGVTFTTKENNGDESFTLKYAEFLHTLDGDALVLKTGSKTYRFKAEESRPRSAARLRDVANRITRARG